MNSRNFLRFGLAAVAGCVALLALALFSPVANAQTSTVVGPGLSITKTGQFGPSNVRFTITATNTTNPPTAIAPATVTDNVPAAYTITSTANSIKSSCTITCTASITGNTITVVFPTLPASSSARFSFTATFAVGTTPPTNTATVAGTINGTTVTVSASAIPPTAPTGAPNTGAGVEMQGVFIPAWGLAGVVLVVIVGGLALSLRRRHS